MMFTYQNIVNNVHNGKPTCEDSMKQPKSCYTLPTEKERTKGSQMFNLENLFKVVTYENGEVIDKEYVCEDESEVEFMENIANEYIMMQGAKIIASGNNFITLDNSEFAEEKSIITVAIER